ncbi:MAG: TM1812 family CRISPR-associated protein [Candidatus Saccharicenans sp.]
MISFIGSGDYQEVNYIIDGKQFKSRLSLTPIIETFHPDVIYVIGTKESKWELLEDLNYQKIEIPYGRNEEELWQIFSSIVEALTIENTEIIFDITHCFRSIPLFVILLSRFLCFIKMQTEIQNIFYGFLDIKTRESRIVDLAPLLEMLEVIDSLNSLEKYGDLKDFSMLLTRKQKKLKNQFPESLKKIKSILDQLDSITEMTYIPQLSEIAEGLDSLLKDQNLLLEAEKYFKPLLFLKSRLQSLADRFKIQPEWKAQLEIAKWYNENRRPSQALLVIREALITYFCQLEGKDIYDNNMREEVEKRLNEARKKPKDEIEKLWDKIAQHRNKTAHALLRKDSLKMNPAKARKKVEDYIREAENFLNRQPGKV